MGRDKVLVGMLAPVVRIRYSFLLELSQEAIGISIKVSLSNSSLKLLYQM